jgi:Spy/CpxP family protein refolding chaperone
MKRFGEELELSPEQSAKIEFILAESQERTRELWEEVAPQMREEVKATQEEIRSVLTPQQQEKFEELMKKRRHDRERKDPPHNPPPGDPPPGPPPPDRDAPTAS